MTNNLITLEDKVTARKKIRLTLIDQLSVDYNTHGKLIEVCALLKIHLNARLKAFHELEKEIGLREEKLIKISVGTEAAFLKKALRG